MPVAYQAQEKKKEGKNRHLILRGFEKERVFLWKSTKKRDENDKLFMLEGAKSMGAGAATIASAGAAVGIGKIDSSLIHSLARSPELDTSLFGYAILGFALTEAIALFALMMAFLISFVFRPLFQGYPTSRSSFTNCIHSFPDLGTRSTLESAFSK